MGADGKLRALHIEQALAVTELCSPKELDFGGHLAQCGYFTVDAVTGAFEGIADETSFVSVLISDGAGKLTCGGQTISFEKGNSFFLPANSGTYALCGSYEALITTV